MNIFVLNEFPGQAAKDLCDKHVVKMILESTQLLSTVTHQRGFEGPYKITHANHPCTKWVATAPANWAWLTLHAMYMCYEYSDRYHKKHKCQDLIQDFGSRGPEIWKTKDFENITLYMEHTPFAQCMPDQYRQADAVEAYRAYYRAEKRDIARWTEPGKAPEWF